MELASLILSAAGVSASIGAWIWACRANQQATRSLEVLRNELNPGVEIVPNIPHPGEALQLIPQNPAV